MRAHRRISLLLLLLCLLIAVTGCASTPKEPDSPYAEYVIPWKLDASQKAADAQELHFYFMSGEGMEMHPDDERGQTKKWGDSCLVVFPNGETMLIDGGDEIYTPVLMENLKRLGVDSLDYVMLSHPHADHFGGFFGSEGVLHTMPVKQAYCNGYALSTFSDNFAWEGIPLTVLLRGDTLEIGGVTLQVLSPDQHQLDNPTSSNATRNTNDASLVVRMDYGEFSALFTGDLYNSGEKRLVNYYKDTDLLDVDMLKLPHHGDVTSSSALFADAVTPKLGVATGAIPLDYTLFLRYAKYADAVLHDYLDGYAHVYTDGTEDGLQWETSRERHTTSYDIKK